MKLRMFIRILAVRSQPDKTYIEKAIYQRVSCSRISRNVYDTGDTFWTTHTEVKKRNYSLSAP